MHPASKASQRAIRYFFKFDSINGGKLLTVNLIFANEAFISCLSRSCLVSVSLPSCCLSAKRAAVNHLCGVSLMLCLSMSYAAGSLYCGQTVRMDQRRFCQGNLSLWHHESVLPGRPQIRDSKL